MKHIERPRLRFLVAVIASLLLTAACTPPADPGPTSPISGTLVPGDSLYQANYFSPTICAPVGTHVKIDGGPHTSLAGVKLYSDSDHAANDLNLFPDTGGSFTLTTIDPCWQVWIALFSFTTITGSTIDYTISWPV